MHQCNLESNRLPFQQTLKIVCSFLSFLKFHLKLLHKIKLFCIEIQSLKWSSFQDHSKAIKAHSQMQSAHSHSFKRFKAKKSLPSNHQRWTMTPQHQYSNPRCPFQSIDTLYLPLKVISLDSLMTPKMQAPRPNGHPFITRVSFQNHSLILSQSLSNYSGTDLTKNHYFWWCFLTSPFLKTVIFTLKLFIWHLDWIAYHEY